MSTTIEAFTRFKATLEAARDGVQPADPIPHHTQGLRAGLQIAIDGIEAEIRLLQAFANAGSQP